MPRPILLINPACKDLRVTDDDAGQVPIGLYYIAALLRENGFDADIVNLADLSADALSVFRQTMEERKPSIVGFSITNPNRINAMECAAVSKQISPDTPVVFGGPAATFLSDHLFSVCPAIDVIVKGEGETTFLELVKTFTSTPGVDPDHVKGIIFRNHQGGLTENTDRPMIQDLDALPHPARHFKLAHLSMSRGCPGRCTFCGSPRFWTGGSVRFHSPEWMFEEIRLLEQHKISHFFMSDDTFTLDKERVLSLCTLICEAGLSITWNAISRVDHVDEDMLHAMRKAGCIQISYGVESGSAEIRKRLGKPLNPDTIVNTFHLTVSYGILPRAYFIYGSPGETQATIEKSIVLMHRIKPLAAIFYMLVVFPGTFLYEQAKKKEVINDDIWCEPVEDLPWFELDDQLDFSSVKGFGDRLRAEFYSNVSKYALSIELVDRPDLNESHARFLSMLGATFSHGDYSRDKRIPDPGRTAIALYKKSLTYHPEPVVFLELATLLQQRQQFSKAETLLDRGLDLFPHDPALHTCMGICLMNMGAFQKALPYFETFKTAAQVAPYIRICQQHIEQENRNDHL